MNIVSYYIWWSYLEFQQNYIEWHINISIISNTNYSSHFSYNLHFLIYNVLSEYTVLLQIPIHYCVSSGLSAHHFCIFITHVVYQPWILKILSWIHFQIKEFYALFLTNNILQYFSIVYKCFQHVISTNILCEDEIWPLNFIIKCRDMAIWFPCLCISDLWSLMMVVLHNWNM